MASDAPLIKQAQLGHFSLQPPASCQSYWPCIASACDQVGDLSWVVADPAATQGTWGSFMYLPLRNFAHGWMELLAAGQGFGNQPTMHCVPGRPGIPSTQSAPSSSGLGWSTASSVAFCFEMQLYVTHSTGGTPSLWVNFYDHADADTASEITVQFIGGQSTAGDVRVNAMGGASGYSTVTATAAAPTNEWCHLALQRQANSTDLLMYANGVLAATLSGTTQLACIDKISLQCLFTNSDHRIYAREVAFYNELRYPTSNTSGSAFTIANTQRRWNSMML
jgi:hypothetical protein